MKIKTVMRHDGGQHKFRLFRLLWQRGTVGDGSGYSVKLSVSLVRRLAGISAGFNEWRVSILGVQAHYKKDFGGIIQ